MIAIKVKKLDPDAIIPTRATEHAAGLDLYACEDCVIRNSGIVCTGIALELPEGLFGKVEARSGMSFKADIETGAGVVDSDYRGEIRVKLYDFRIHTDGYWINKGDRIAQIIIQRYEKCELIEVDKLDDTERGDRGFGHSGK